MSVEAIDVVTADGELVRADERRTPTCFWAARGAGPGFFGVVTRFHLRLQPRPRQSSPTASTSTRSTCSRRSSAGRTRSGRECRATMELMLFVHRDARGRAGDRGDRPGARRQRRRGARGARAARDVPGARAGRSWPSPTSTVELADLYAGVHAVLPRRPPLRRRQHVDPRARSRSCCPGCAGSPRRCRRRRRTCCG